MINRVWQQLHTAGLGGWRTTTYDLGCTKVASFPRMKMIYKFLQRSSAKSRIVSWCGNTTCTMSIDLQAILISLVDQQLSANFSSCCSTQNICQIFGMRCITRLICVPNPARYMAKRFHSLYSFWSCLKMSSAIALIILKLRETVKFKSPPYLPPLSALTFWQLSLKLDLHELQ